MARVPDEAIRRRSELTSGAWNLYTLYCYHRNAANGLCSPSNTTLAKEMACSYTHVSDSKTELIRKGWIERQGRQRVTLLVGDFPPLKVRDLGQRTSENSELQLRKIPNLEAANFGKFRTSTSENSELGATPPTTPYKDLTPIREPVAAATTAAEETDFRKQPLDDAFCSAIIEARLYTPNLVEFVKNKLVFHCVQEGTTPTKGRLLHWLSLEREEPIQRLLPTMDHKGEVTKGNFSDPSRHNHDLSLPSPNCFVCHGNGVAGHYCECEMCPHCSNSGFKYVTRSGKGLIVPCNHERNVEDQPQRSAEAG